ncbi:MAG: TonB-dependent receptor [Bacteroidota bacterium]
MIRKIKLQVVNSSFFINFILAVVLFFVQAQLIGQQRIKITNEKNEAIDEAIVAFFPVGNSARQKMAVTNNKGEVFIKSKEKIVFTVSKVGFENLSDTIETGQTKTYIIKRNNTNFKDVVITGQFEQNTIDKSVQKVKIIDRKRIEQQGAVNLKDVLSNELNIRITQDGVLGTQMNMMGLDGQNVKILIDGVPVLGRLDGNIDISQINLNNVERIEIVEGPMSVIYGTDALGGVINIITKKANARKYSLNANIYNESVGTYNADANVGFNIKKIQVAIGGGRNYFDGFSRVENDSIRQLEWKPKEQYFFNGEIKYSYKNQIHRFTTQYFNELIKSKANPTITPYSISALDDYFITNRTTNSLYSDFFFSNKATLTLINSFGTFERNKIRYVKNLVTGENKITPNASDHDTSKFNLVLLRGTYTTRTNSIFNSQLGYDINLETGYGKKLENNTQNIGDYALFYISDIKATPKLNIRQGIRFIYNTRYGAPVVPNFNIKYDLTKNLFLRASYSQGFRAPSLKELSLLFVDVNHNIRGNKDLKAETSNNFLASLSYNYQYKKLITKSDVSVFYNDIKDLISLAIVDPVNQLYSYVNIEKYKTLGLNFNSQIAVKNIQFNLGYGRIGRYNQLSTSNNVSEFSYTNEYRLNTTYSIKKWGTDVNLFYKYNGRLPGFGLDADNNIIQTYVSDYSMVDGSISKSFYKNKLVIIFGVKNILDVTNISVNSSSATHSSNSNNIPTAMGRFYFTSIRFSIEKN